MVKSSILLMIITIFSKILGFLRDILLSYFYGASGISDAYLISQTIPDIFFMTIGAAISTGFIPLYASLKQKNNNKLEERFTNNLVNIFVILSVMISIIGILFSPQIVNVFAAGFTGETLSMTITLTRMSFIGLIFTTLTALFSSYLQANNEFIVSGSIGVPLNVITSIFIVISAYTNNLILGIGSVVAHVLQFLYLIPVLKKNNYVHTFVLDIKDENIIKLFYMSIPVILGVSVNQLNNIVDRTIASTLTSGGVSALSYGGRINNLIQSLFIITILTIVYPSLSRLAAKKNKEFKSLLSKTLSIVCYLTIPSTVGLMIFSEEIVKLLFGRGNFTIEASLLTSEVLFFYSFGLFFIGIQQVLLRAFYSLQDTRTPATNAIIGLLINIVLSFILSRYLGIGGVALATSISSMIISVLLAMSFRKKIGPFGVSELLKSLVKIIGASFLMGVSVYISNSIMIAYIPRNISLIFSIILGGAIYALITYLFKLEEITLLLNLIKRKISGK